MSKFYSRPVLTCTADGKIRNLDAEAMQTLVEECRREVDRIKDAGEKAKRLISTADICRINGYFATALELYRTAIEVIKNHAWDTFSHKNKELLYMASRGIDAIHSALPEEDTRFQTEQGPTALEKAIYFYMALRDEYLYTCLNIDNDVLYEEKRRFAAKHGIDPYKDL